MSDGKGAPPKKRFPLTLDSVAGKAGRNRPDSESPHLHSPQTAIQNAARHVTRKPAPLAARPVTVTAPATAASASSLAPAPGSASMPAMASRTMNSPLVSEAVRKAMVKRIEQQGVKDTAVLAAMESVPRHFFLESGLASQAYIDASLPIGYHQTISQPYIVARMIEVMRANTRGPLNRVLEIGTGCGYQAAVLAQVAGEVYSIERIKPLHELARNNLRPFRIPNLRLHYGDGMLGFPDVAPFDGIILAAAGLQVPQALLDQMSVGGSLVAPIGNRNQVLQLVRRTGKHDWTSETLEPCHFVPLKSGTLG